MSHCTHSSAHEFVLRICVGKLRMIQQKTVVDEAPMLVFNAARPWDGVTASVNWVKVHCPVRWKGRLYILTGGALVPPLVARGVRCCVYARFVTNVCMKHVIEPLSPNLLQLLLDAVHCERTRSTSNATSFSIQAVIASLFHGKKCNFNLYNRIFETPFLEDAGSYYKLVLPYTWYFCWH